jgi:elongin-A
MVLKKVESPNQLREIEENCPQIAGEDAELWRAFIARDIPTWQTKNYVPKDPKKWYKVYSKYMKEQKEDIARDEQMLRERMAGLKKEKDGMLIAVVDRRQLPKLPKDSRMVANAGILNGSSKKGFRRDAPSSLTWTSGSKTKTTDGKSVLTRVRREAAEVARRNKLASPAHMRLGQVKRAPEAMVNAYKRAEQPRVAILTRRNIVGRLPVAGPSLEDREERLRALTMKKQPPPPPAEGETVVGDSDEEGDQSSADDLFDEPPRHSAPARPTGSSNSKSSGLSRLSASSRPIPKPVPSSQPLPRRPDTTSMGIKPKPQPRTMNSSPAPSRTNSPAGFHRSPSPGPPKPSVMPRKRPEVDVFNRKVKKPRMA